MLFAMDDPSSPSLSLLSLFPCHRFRPGNKSAQGNNEADDNSSSTSNVLASESSVSSGPSVSKGQTANCNPARVDGWLSYSLTSDQSNSSQAKSAEEHKSQTACTASDVNGERQRSGVGITIDSPLLQSSSSPSSSFASFPSFAPLATHPASRVTSHEDPLINLLNGCSCCSIDLLAQRLHSNSLMALFLTPLTGHPLVTPAKEEIDPTRPSHSHVKKSPPPTALYSSSSPLQSSTVAGAASSSSSPSPSPSCTLVHSSREFDCPIQCNSQSIQSSTTPFTKLLLTTDSSANVSPLPCSTSTSCTSTCTATGSSLPASPSTSSSHQPSNSSVQRDCLTYLYPDSCSCTCAAKDDHLNTTGTFAPCNLPIKAPQSESCIREALIAKLKGMFITLCHVTRDITNQLPITCTISLDEASNCSYANSKCSFDKKRGNEARHSFNRTRRTAKAFTKQSYGGQFNSGHDEGDANTAPAASLYDEEGCPDEYCLESSSPAKQGQSITGEADGACACSSGSTAVTRKYRVAFIHEFTSILVLAIPEWMDSEIITVTSLIASFSQMIRFSFGSLDAAFKNTSNHKLINSYLDLICTLFMSPVSLSKYTSQLKNTSVTLNTSSTILSPVMGLVQKIALADDELYTEISDKLSEYETKDWTRFDCNYLKKQRGKMHPSNSGRGKNENENEKEKEKDREKDNVSITKQQSDSQSENDDEAIKTNEVTESKLTHKSIQPVLNIPGGCPGDFLVVGSIFFQKGYLIHSHVPFYFQPDLINFVKVRGLLDLTSRHSCKLVLWQEVHPTGSNKHLIHLAPSSNIYSSQNTKRPGALADGSGMNNGTGVVGNSIGITTFFGSKSSNNNNNDDEGVTPGASGHTGISPSPSSSSSSRNSNYNSITGGGRSGQGKSLGGDADDTFGCLAHDAVDYSAHSGRFFLLAIGIKQTLFTVLLEVPFIFSTEPVIAPNEAIIVQSIRFVISSLQRSGLTDEINDHLLTQSLAQFCHEECLAKCITEEKKSITARTLLKSAKSLRDLLSFSTNDTNNKEETKHSENESRSSLKQVDDLSRTSGTFLRGRTNEPDESVTCVPLVNSLHQPYSPSTSSTSSTAAAYTYSSFAPSTPCASTTATGSKNKSKALKGSKEKNSLLKKAQSSPSLTPDAPFRQLANAKNGNSNYKFTPHLVSPLTNSTFATCVTRNNITTATTNDTSASCISFCAPKSLSNEYKERLSSLLPKNVLLFTDVNLKTGTFYSSLLLPLVEEETMSLQEDELMRMHKRSKSKMNHRLSFLVLSKYREAMICLNRHLDEMPLVKECGLSFVVASCTQGQRVRTHNEFCGGENNTKSRRSGKSERQKDTISGSKRTAKTITRNTNGDNECHSQLHHLSQLVNDSLDFSDGFKDGRNNNYQRHQHQHEREHEERRITKSTSRVNNDECNAYSQAGETFSSSCSKKRTREEAQEGAQKLTYEGACLKATYWVSAYRESPVRTVFACFLLPKKSNSKNKAILSSGTGGSKSLASVTYSTSTKNNSSSGNNRGGLTMASHEATQRLLDSGLISMESIAYALEVASKDW